MQVPEDRLRLVEHLVAAHQGRYEWQSPREPQTLEALLLHYADDTDAKMQQALDLVRAGEEGWTDYSRSLPPLVPEAPRGARPERGATRGPDGASGSGHAVALRLTPSGADGAGGTDRDGPGFIFQACLCANGAGALVGTGPGFSPCVLVRQSRGRPGGDTSRYSSRRGGIELSGNIGGVVGRGCRPSSTSTLRRAHQHAPLSPPVARSRRKPANPAYSAEPERLTPQ